MPSALEAFQAQREAVEQVHEKLIDVGKLVQSFQRQVAAVAQDHGLRDLLQAERGMLERAERVIGEVRRLREQELARFWPGVWRRWIVAVVLGLGVSASFGGGYVWANRPYEAELLSLRRRVEVLDFIAQRVLTMTPAERRQFDLLMKDNGSAGR